MEIYEYDKSFLDRLEESMLVLSLKEDCVPASEIKSLWKSFLELQIEPAGECFSFVYLNSVQIDCNFL